MENRRRAARHWTTVALALVLAAAATFAAVVREAGSAGAQQTTATSATATGTAAPAQRPLSFGVDYSDTLPWMSDSALAAALDDAVDLGARWIRVDLAWEDYQSTSAAFAPDFARFDRVVRAANARGLHILATIDFPPVWARAAGCSGNPDCPPSNPAQYAQFAADAVRHYAPMGLQTWEIWNEPNNQSWAPRPNPAAYAKLLRDATGAIHGADAKALVMLGGLAASQSHPGWPYVAAPEFIAAVAADGGLAGVGAVGYHPYPNPDVAASNAIQAIQSTPDNLVAALSRAGHPTMPIWITETGFSSPEVSAGTAGAAGEAAVQQTQASVATQLVQALAAIPNVASMFWYTDQDQPHLNVYYGLRTAGGVRRPVFTALRNAIAADLKGRG